MVFIHFIYDLTNLYGLLPWGNHPLFLLVKNWGGIAFFLISGICATLGSREVRRGAAVFGCGLLVSAVTGLVSPEMPIRFGVLHCLGLCMILWHFLKKFPTPVLTAGAPAIILTGFAFERIRVSSPWLYPIGLTCKSFYSPDFFPLLPYLGYFLLGAALGRRLYRQRSSLIPLSNEKNPAIRFLLLCGRHSLMIYLLHQPALMLIIETTL